MDQETTNRLIEINKSFYRDFAEQFSSTRMRVQPGIQRIIAQIPENATILDIGCGNGELYLELWRNGFRGNYTGIDFSFEMVNIARERWNTNLNKFETKKEIPVRNPIFLERDITAGNWSLDLSSKTYNFILVFAVLHHIPGMEVRINLMKETHKLLHPTGFLYISVWQFLNSTRLKKRILPWEEVGLDNTRVDPMDYLLDWKHKGYGLRYVHHFSLAELKVLADRTGFSIINTFNSDGEGANLGLYQSWKRKNKGTQ